MFSSTHEMKHTARVYSGVRFHAASERLPSVPEPSEDFGEAVQRLTPMRLATDPATTAKDQSSNEDSSSFMLGEPELSTSDQTSAKASRSSGSQSLETSEARTVGEASTGYSTRQRKKNTTKKKATLNPIDDLFEGLQ